MTIDLNVFSGVFRIGLLRISLPLSLVDVRRIGVLFIGVRLVLIVVRRDDTHVIIMVSVSFKDLGIILAFSVIRIGLSNLRIFSTCFVLRISDIVGAKEAAKSAIRNEIPLPMVEQCGMVQSS
jgi:hypothetical protein